MREIEGGEGRSSCSEGGEIYTTHLGKQAMSRFLRLFSAAFALEERKQ